MLKLEYAINAIIAGILVVPAVTLQGKETRSLEEALRETSRALEILSGIQKSEKPSATGALELVKQATEPPITDPLRRDALLVTLREDVGRLQMLYDEALRTRGPRTSAEPVPVFDTPASRGVAAPMAFSITTGLDDEARRNMFGASTTPIATSLNRGAGLAKRPANDATSAEAPGFSADPLRQAQACYRAGRYAESLALLKTIAGDVRATYWSAKALERLDRAPEAIDLYKKVAAAGDAGYLAQRAKDDFEYLEWKRDFAGKLASKSKEAP